MKCCWASRYPTCPIGHVLPYGACSARPTLQRTLGTAHARHCARSALCLRHCACSARPTAHARHCACSALLRRLLGTAQKTHPRARPPESRFFVRMEPHTHSSLTGKETSGFGGAHHMHVKPCHAKIMQNHIKFHAEPCKIAQNKLFSQAHRRPGRARVAKQNRAKQAPVRNLHRCPGECGRPGAANKKKLAPKKNGKLGGGGSEQAFHCFSHKH